MTFTSEMSRFTETKVASSGRTLTIQVPKAPALGFFEVDDDTGKLFCPGLIVAIPSAEDIHVAVIDTLAATSRISVEKDILSVKGATMRLEADGELSYTLSVQDPSAAKGFRVELERSSGYLWVRSTLASSKEGPNVTGTWIPASPSQRRVIVGYSNPFSGDAKPAMEAGRVLRCEGKGEGMVIGDPVPHTDYRIRLVAKKSWWERDQVDEAAISFR